MRDLWNKRTLVKPRNAPQSEKKQELRMERAGTGDMEWPARSTKSHSSFCSRDQSRISVPARLLLRGPESALSKRTGQVTRQDFTCMAWTASRQLCASTPAILKSFELPPMHVLANLPEQRNHYLQTLSTVANVSNLHIVLLLFDVIFAWMTLWGIYKYLIILYTR